MNAIEFLLTTLSPVLVTKPGGGDANSEVTLPYIPGSAIRGMLIAQWLADHPNIDAAAHPAFRRLFLDGGVRYLNAYPALSNGARMLPTPLSWRQEKDSESDVVIDFAFGRNDRATNKAQPTWQKPKEMFSAVVAVEIDESAHDVYSIVQVCNPQETIAIHTARKDRQQVTSADATVFRYDALAADQTFASAIVADDLADLVEIQRLLSDGVERRLGRSQNTGYGRVRIGYPANEMGEPQTAPCQNWYEWSAPTEDGYITEQPERLVVTLLSDAIIRDPQTGAETDDITVAIHLSSQERVKPISRFVQTGVVGGFNRRWNLPLPQATAVSAGSVFVFAYDEALHHELERLAEQGVGERRAEGFGRIAVNWQCSHQVHRRSAYLFSATPSGDVELTGEAAAAAQQLATRILRNRLDDKLRSAINNSHLAHNGMRKAQLSRLRVITQRALVENRDATTKPTTIPLLLQYLKDLKKPARDQLVKARISGTPLLNWLHSLALNPSSVADKLKANDMAVTIGGQTVSFTDDGLQVEYALQLIDGVLLLTAKQAEEVEYA